MSGMSEETKKKRILDVAEDLSVEQFTPAEVEQIKREARKKTPTKSKKRVTRRKT